MRVNTEKPKSEAMIRFEKADANRVKKHQKKLEKEVEMLMRQYGINKIS